MKARSVAAPLSACPTCLPRQYDCDQAAAHAQAPSAVEEEPMGVALCVDDLQERFVLPTPVYYPPPYTISTVCLKGGSLGIISPHPMSECHTTRPRLSPAPAHPQCEPQVHRHLRRGVRYCRHQCLRALAGHAPGKRFPPAPLPLLPGECRGRGLSTLCGSSNVDLSPSFFSFRLIIFSFSINYIQLFD